MSIVLDSSAAIAWIYAEETTLPIRQVFSQIARQGAWVPSLWRLEVANVLEMGVRRGRHKAAFRDETFADLQLLPITVDTETDRHAWSTTAALAACYGLTLYDAAYLELAKRKGMPLASLDVHLRRAAEKEGVIVLGL